MNKTKILESLCYFSTRNPIGAISEYDGLELIKAHDESLINNNHGCFCDNCFRGKTKLAEQLIKSYELLESAANQLQDNEENGYNNSTAMKIFKHLELD